MADELTRGGSQSIDLPIEGKSIHQSAISSADSKRLSSKKLTEDATWKPIGWYLGPFGGQSRLVSPI